MDNKLTRGQVLIELLIVLTVLSFAAMQFFNSQIDPISIKNTYPLAKKELK